MLTLATLSHGVLDAFTDGGLGVGFFIPFDLDRHFVPWRPIEVSPIGWATWSQAASIARSELLAVWLPVLFLGLLGWLRRRGLERRRPAEHSVRPSRGGEPRDAATGRRGFVRSWRVMVAMAMLAIVLLVARELGVYDLSFGRLEVDDNLRANRSAARSSLVWSFPLPIRMWVGVRPAWVLADGPAETWLVATRSEPLGPATMEGERIHVLVGFRELHRRGLPWLPFFKRVQLDGPIDVVLEIDDGHEKWKRNLQVRVDIRVRALGIFARRAVDEAISLRIGEILQQRVRQEIDRVRERVK